MFPIKIIPQARGCIYVTQVSQRQRLEEQEFKAILRYRVSFRTARVRHCLTLLKNK